MSMIADVVLTLLIMFFLFCFFGGVFDLPFAHQPSARFTFKMDGLRQKYKINKYSEIAKTAHFNISYVGLSPTATSCEVL